MESTSGPSLGPTLVIGGCGFLGFHLCQALVKEGHSPVYALSRNPSKNRQDGVEYLACDINNAAELDATIEKIQPKTIFHTASPLSSGLEVQSKEFGETNVSGTRNVIASATKCPASKALVFTSTVSVITGSPHLNENETHPMSEPGSGSGSPYEQSKVQAEKLMVEANGDNIRTTILRTCLIYGERDNQFVPGMLAAFHKGQTNVQLGDNTNQIDTLYAGNGAIAHILAAQALLDPSRANGKVDGEAFNITDGNPQPFWDVARHIWVAAGDTTDPKDIKVIPAWVAMAMASVAEFVYMVGTMGRRKPTAFNKLIVIHCVRTYTYNIDKARRVLGYNPVPDLKGGITRSVEWEMQKKGVKEA
ncbi:hypothetical protein MMC25_005998 [Agyrium rufum]|nr:hypothetical protein [Agyrium rufum]